MIELLSSLVLVAGLGLLLGYRLGYRRGYRLGYRRGDEAGFRRNGCTTCFENGKKEGREAALSGWSKKAVLQDAKTAKTKKKKSTKRKASK